MENTVKRDYSILHDKISKENVLPMSELIALICTKSMIKYAGELAIDIHNKLVTDIYNMNNPNYTISGSYDLVQNIALFLCEHYGEYLDNYYETTKKGKIITLKYHCHRLINREINTIERKKKSTLNLDYLPKHLEPKTETTEEINNDNSWDNVDKIISSMNLTENHKIVLRERLAGTSMPEIAKMLNRCLGTIGDLWYTIQRRYIKTMQNFDK